MPLAAQEATPVDQNNTLTRTELEAQAATAERANDATKAAAIRERLRDGDFKVGDRVVITVQGETFVTDTFTVRTGQTISLPNLPDISLRGVLRAELTDYLTREIGRYIRNPSVKTTSLIRVAVLGEVSNPGFFSVPADYLVSDVIMAAGGPTALADLKKSELRREQKVVLDKDDMQQAIASGTTLDRLDVRPGDEFRVGQQKKIDWWTAARTVGAVLGVVGTIIALTN
jgi:protein involved in polysaccharide export with SLBB domain